MFLSSLNSGKVAFKKLEQTRSWLNAILELPFYDSYKIASAFIENAVQRHESTSDNPFSLKYIFNATIMNTKMIEALSIRSSTYTSKNFKSHLSLKETENELFEPGDREEAIQYIRDWLEKEAEDYVKICDTFFNKRDLDFIKLILAIKPDLEVSILTSEIEDNGKPEDFDAEAEFLNYWNDISDQEPPFTKIIIVKVKKTNKSPFHDRYIFSKNSGLRIGASFNGLGISRDSEISKMNFEQAKKIETSLDNYINMTEKFKNGERLTYKRFDL